MKEPEVGFMLFSSLTSPLVLKIPEFTLLPLYCTPPRPRPKLSYSIREIRNIH